MFMSWRARKAGALTCYPWRSRGNAARRTMTSSRINALRPNRRALGKGEVHSSILCGSTTKSRRNQPFPGHLRYTGLRKTKAELSDSRKLQAWRIRGKCSRLIHGAHDGRRQACSRPKEVLPHVERVKDLVSQLYVL